MSEVITAMLDNRLCWKECCRRFRIEELKDALDCVPDNELNTLVELIRFKLAIRNISCSYFSPPPLTYGMKWRDKD